MIRVVVTGIGLVSALGNNLEDSWRHLISGKSGIMLHQPFAELAPLPLGLIGDRPVELKNLTQQVVTAALQDASLVPPLPDCGIVIGSSRSYQAQLEKMARWMYGKEINNYSPFSSSLSLIPYLPHMNAIAAAHLVGATGIVKAPMAACATGIWALFQGFNLIKSGRCQRVIAGAVEAPITPLTIAGFSKMAALAKTGAYPFDVYREGLVLGEGGAIFVLESAELAIQRKAKIYGEIFDFGLTADAHHPNQPDSQGRSAMIAVKECLHRAHISPQNIDYIHAHGTATQMNDQVESLLIQKIFDDTVAVSSTKGATGHTLGASGALGVAFTLMSLQNKILPPCVGLKESEFDLNLVREARESSVEKAMCFSFGFGGQNAVVVLGNGNLIEGGREGGNNLKKI